MITASAIATPDAASAVTRPTDPRGLPWAAMAGRVFARFGCRGAASGRLRAGCAARWRRLRAWLPALARGATGSGLV